MLTRSLLDAVGTFACAIGTEYASSGILLRAVLVPLLERLGDPSPAVATAAEEVLVAVCDSCNYTGLRDLVAQNLDYIVDGLCAQLRQIESYPRYALLMWSSQDKQSQRLQAILPYRSDCRSCTPSIED